MKGRRGGRYKEGDGGRGERKREGVREGRRRKRGGGGEKEVKLMLCWMGCWRGFERQRPRGRFRTVLQRLKKARTSLLQAWVGSITFGLVNHSRDRCSRP